MKTFYDSRLRPRQVVCIECGKEFTAYDDYTALCGRDCSEAYWGIPWEDGSQEEK